MSIRRIWQAIIRDDRSEYSGMGRCACESHAEPEQDWGQWSVLTRWARGGFHGAEIGDQVETGGAVPVLYVADIRTEWADDQGNVRPGAVVLTSDGDTGGDGIGWHPSAEPTGEPVFVERWTRLASSQVVLRDSFWIDPTTRDRLS